MTQSNETGEQPKAGPFGLSFSQIVGGALAAMAATFLGSTLGVSGTVLGAALASVSAAVLGTVITHTIRRARGVRPPAGTSRRTAPPAHPGRLVYIAVLLGVAGLMLSFGGVLGMHLAENLSPYLNVVDLKRYVHRLAVIAQSRNAHPGQ